MRFKNYNSGYRIVSLAFQESVKSELLQNDLSTLFVCNNEVLLYPENVVLSCNPEQIKELSKYNNYDVLEIFDNGNVFRRYDDASDDNCLLITNGCNSNCIMCPSPESSRKNHRTTNIEHLITLAEHIPSDAKHLTITGGEPFLIGDSIFSYIGLLKSRFAYTEFLFLTNGRIFSINKYADMLKKSIPTYSLVAIPIHGSCASIHDSITRVHSSFEQTKSGIKNLLKRGISVELRLVVSKLNVDDFDNISKLIIKEFKGIQYVSIIAMEMTGSARINKDIVWIPYKEAFSRIESSIRRLIRNGIDVMLYNFPLCTVNSSFWVLCKKSISKNKIRFTEECNSCKYRKDCGGVFAGTYQFEKDELKAIL